MYVFKIEENSEESLYISRESFSKLFGLFTKLWTGEHITYIWPNTISLSGLDTQGTISAILYKADISV